MSARERTLRMAGSLDTLTDEELARTLQVDVAALSDVAKTLAQRPNSTIEPPGVRSDAPGRRALAGLGEQRDERGIGAGLDLDKTIGEGGMGIVRLATQRSLGRQVAVKTLKPEAKSENTTLRLLREAWVTGTLEHPNIVPVYDLGLDDDGSPIIVLKRIEGVEWATLIADPVAVRERFGATDLLEYNLRILIQLCNAVSLAHSHGILHRDLKPENVMIGRYGEVYLVDWGIAVSLAEDPTGRLPLAREATEMAGTPAYMAPEMLGGMGKLSTRTDIYLLGAVLHEILTGRAPHRGDTFRQMVVSILLSRCELPSDVPRELAEIARKAMSRDPDARFASAEELRQRIEWYLRHRGSLALSAEARARMAEMRELLAVVGAADDIRDRLYHLFAEARFGFQQAIAASEHNADALEGIRAATEVVVSFELERGTAEAAAAALAALDDPPADLARRVNEALRARADQKKKIEQLEQLGADLDPATGRRTRMAVTGMLGVVWTVAPEVTGFIEAASSNPPRWAMYVWTGAIVVLGTLAVQWGRESLTKTMVNRRVIAAGGIAFAGQLALELGCNLLGVAWDATVILHLLLWFSSLCTVAAFIDRRLWPSAAVSFTAFVAACLLPQWRWHIMSASNLVLLVNFVAAWSRPNEDSGFFVERMRERVEQFERMGRSR